MSCPHCGSWAVRADRSLAGRLVCARCGLPLTGGRRAGWSGLRRSTWRLRLATPQRWRLALVLVLLGSAWLAAIGPGSSPRFSPAERQGVPSIRGPG